MAEINLRHDLVRRLEALAEQEHRPIDEVLDSVLDQYTPSSAVASDEADSATLLRQDRQRIYERARRYWRKVNDDRQYLTDDELHDQFLLFDREGIPHLKSDQGSFESHPSPLKKMLEIMEADPKIEWQDKMDLS